MHSSDTSPPAETLSPPDCPLLCVSVPGALPVWLALLVRLHEVTATQAAKEQLRAPEARAGRGPQQGRPTPGLALARDPAGGIRLKDGCGWRGQAGLAERGPALLCTGVDACPAEGLGVGFKGWEAALGMSGPPRACHMGRSLARSRHGWGAGGIWLLRDGGPGHLAACSVPGGPFPGLPGPLPTPAGLRQVP